MRDFLIRLLLLLGAVAYIWAIVRVGQISVTTDNVEEVIGEDGKVVFGSDGKPLLQDSPPPDIPEFYIILISSLGAVLAVQTGNLLGIETEFDIQARKGEEVSKLKKFFMPLWKNFLDKILKFWKNFSVKNVPKLASLLYIIGLLIAFWFYYKEEFSPVSAELLKTSWTSMIGLFVGAWSINDEEND